MSTVTTNGFRTPSIGETLTLGPGSCHLVVKEIFKANYTITDAHCKEIWTFTEFQDIEQALHLAENFAAVAGTPLTEDHVLVQCDCGKTAIVRTSFFPSLKNLIL